MSGAKESQVMAPAIAMVWRRGLWVGGRWWEATADKLWKGAFALPVVKSDHSVHLSIYQSKSLQFKQPRDSGK